MYDEAIRLVSSEIPAKISPGFPQGAARFTPMHYHNEIELLYVSADILYCTVKNEDIALSEGDILFINSRVPHATHHGENTAYGMIQINTDKFFFGKSLRGFISALCADNGSGYCLFRENDKYSEELRTLFCSIFDEYASKKSGNLLFVIGDLYSVCGLLVRAGALSDPEGLLESTKLKKLMPVINYISENYMREITIPELGELLDLSSSHFCRLFKSATGKTCVDFINNIRIYNAEKLINSTEKTLIDIAMETGFSSLSYFNRTFKRLKGFSPSYYRKLRFGDAVDKTGV